MQRCSIAAGLREYQGRSACLIADMMSIGVVMPKSILLPPTRCSILPWGLSEPRFRVSSGIRRIAAGFSPKRLA
jgi:hypothetical protein